MFYLNGLKSIEPKFHIVDNPFQHLNDKSLLHNAYAFSGYPYFHDIPDEAGLYDEPYGYETGDDPFETTGKASYVLLLVTFGFVFLAHCSNAFFSFNNRKTGQVLVH